MDHSLNSVSQPEVTAADYFVDRYGEDIEAAMETAIAMRFDKEIEGTPMSHSQFNQRYIAAHILCDVAGRQFMDVVGDLGVAINSWMARYVAPDDRVIVWRIRPCIRAATTEEGKPIIVARFRAHTLKEIPECLPPITLDRSTF